METEYDSFEESIFLNLDNSRVASAAGNYTIDAAITANEAARLNGSDANRRVGPGKMLAVSPDDDIDMEVMAYYSGTISGNNAQSEATLTTAVAAAFGGVSGGGTEQQAIYDLFDDSGFSILVGSGGTSAQPRAYLNYILFDQDFNYVDAGFKQITSLAGDDATHETVTLSKSISQGGFIYVYVSNESTANFDVYFDDLRITHNKGTILQEDHYYPFGMNISALSSTAPLSKPNNFKYNGKEFDTDLDLGWYHYGARMYDPQISRFTTIDPLADNYTPQSPYTYAANNPTNLVDFNGEGPSDPQPPFQAYNELSINGTATGRINVYRITGSQRKAINVNKTIVTTVLTPVGIIESLYNFFSKPSSNTLGEAAMTNTAAGLKGWSLLMEQAVKTDKMLNAASKGKISGWSVNSAKIANGIGGLQVALAFLESSESTASETLEGFTFMFASKLFSGVSVNIANKGLLNIKKGTFKSASDASNHINALYLAIAIVTAGEDLSGNNSANVWNDVVYFNQARIQKLYEEILKLMTIEKEEDEEKEENEDQNGDGNNGNSNGN